MAPIDNRYVIEYHFTVAENVKTLFILPIVIIGTALISFVLRNILFRFLHRWTGDNDARIGDLIIATFKTPSLYWCIVVGLYAGISISELPAIYVHYLSKGMHIVIILSVTLATSTLFVKILENYTQRSKIPIPTAGIMYGVLRGSILIIGLLVMLSMLGISIAPLITVLGIGGLAVALALQDTLSNLFSGLNIIASMQLRAGDYIRLNTGEEGYVSDITWRNTAIRSQSNNMIIIPNSKLGSAMITNYDLPEKEMGLSIQVEIGHGNNLENVERITINTAKRIMETIPGGVPGFEPSLRYGLVRESGVLFSINLRVESFAGQYLVRHEFIKELMKRFKEEKVEFPMPAAAFYPGKSGPDESR